MNPSNSGSAPNELICPAVQDHTNCHCGQFIMPIKGNAFTQISPCNGGQWWNGIGLSPREPHTIHFDGATFPCQWEYTTDNDGQWRIIYFACSRHRHIPTTDCPWPVEQYVRVSRDLWILNFQPRGAQEVRRWNATGERQCT